MITVMMEPTWRKFEKLIQEIFNRTPGAKVNRDAVVRGASGSKRKLELLVTYPFQIKFAYGFEARIPIVIAVDCKEHKRPVNIATLGAFADQMRDINAPVGIMVSTSGFDKGARARAQKANIFAIDAYTDLLMLARGIEAPDFHLCKECREDTSDSDHAPGFVDWGIEEETEQQPVWGNCTRCNVPHALCPDCGEITGFLESDYDEWIECNGGCGRLYRLEKWYQPDDSGYDSETVTNLQIELLKQIQKSKTPITLKRLKPFINKTKWKYARRRYLPVEGLVALGFITIHWTAEADTTTTKLTKLGEDFLSNGVSKARGAYYGW